MTNSLLLKLAIEIVSLIIQNGDYVSLCKRLPEGTGFRSHLELMSQAMSQVTRPLHGHEWPIGTLSDTSRICQGLPSGNQRLLAGKSLRQMELQLGTVSFFPWRKSMAIFDGTRWLLNPVA